MEILSFEKKKEYQKGTIGTKMVFKRLMEGGKTYGGHKRILCLRDIKERSSKLKSFHSIPVGTLVVYYGNPLNFGT